MGLLLTLGDHFERLRLSEAKRALREHLLVKLAGYCALDEMRTMHLIHVHEQVGCTVHVKKWKGKRKKKGPKVLGCSLIILGHLSNKFCLCWPAHVRFFSLNDGTARLCFDGGGVM